MKSGSRISFFIFALVAFVAFASSASSLKAQTVYKTPSGAKYHTATCHTVKNVSEAITLEKAIELGLEPCKICKPVVVNSQSEAGKEPQGEGKSVQCAGITKAGTRCKHFTRIANGYCFQHQPK